MLDTWEKKCLENQPIQTGQIAPNYSVMSNKKDKDVPCYDRRSSRVAYEHQPQIL